MNIIKTQCNFVKDVISLLSYIENTGFKVSFGETFRPYELQLLYLHGKSLEETESGLQLIPGKKKEFTKTSKHLKRLAIDLNFFLSDGFEEFNLTYDIDLLRPIGEYWESLNENNVWGGFWTKSPDVTHFQTSY
jgi:hypothetical protein